MMRMLLEGDCAEKMRDLAPNSIDAIVTDPPYGLEFMGAGWDAPWKSDDHVGKTWNTGMNEVVMPDGYKRLKRPSYENTQNVRCKKCGKWRLSSNPCTCSNPDFPNIKLSNMRSFQQYLTPIFAEALRVAKPGAHLLAFGGTRTYHRLACAIEDAGWEVRDCIMWVYGSGFPKSMDVAKAIDKASGYEGKVIGTRIVDVGMQGGNMHAGRKQQQQQQIRALSPEAAAWNGWGTCLKPAVEPIVIARKPLEGTVAANVLKYGTGAINIDGCRVPGSWKPKNTNETAPIGKPCQHVADHKWGLKETVKTPSMLGRFPANLIHDGSDEVLALFPDTGASSGMKTFGKTPHDSKVNCYGSMIRFKPWMGCSDDGGSAARFFYCAKASRSDRGEGNVHPTVKPLALMRYLVRLVTPKGGIVLDPFMGSGTTGVAAIQEGMNFVGIERDPHYYEIASRRVNDAKPTQPTTTQEELPL